MQILGEWARRIGYLLRRSTHEAALREEMLAHREQMRDSTAFGNARRLQEESDEVWGWARLDDVARDVRYALTLLRRAPAFAAAAVLSLALATGVTTAIFSVVNAVVLRPLPFARPHELVQMYGREFREDHGGPADPVRGPLTGEEMDAYQQSTSLTGAAAYSISTAHISTAAGTERLTAVDVDTNLFDLLG